MAIEIDQSGKIEQTEKNTVLCLSNDEWYTILIPSRVKRQLQEIFRRNGQIRNFILFTFSAGLAMLLRKLKTLHHIIIDKEYEGKEHIIKNILSEILDEKDMISSVSFGNIGKQSMAHTRANDVAVGKLKPQKIISWPALWREIKKTEVGKRLKNA